MRCKVVHHDFLLIGHVVASRIKSGTDVGAKQDGNHSSLPGRVQFPGSAKTIGDGVHGEIRAEAVVAKILFLSFF